MGDTEPKKTRKVFGLNLENITFKTNWATIVALFGLLTGCAYLYVVNQQKTTEIAEFKVKIEMLEKHQSETDSLVTTLDAYVIELLKKSSELSEYDGMIFYKDVYFENRFRQIDGKQYLEFVPDKMDFYRKTMPGGRPLPTPALSPNSPPPTN